MIGLYTQNKNSLSQLVSLLSDLSVEAYLPNKNYTALIWLSDQKPPRNTPLLVPTELPWTQNEWRLFIQKHLIQTSRYTNSFFTFDASQRLLTNLMENSSIILTEKETAFLAFLVQAEGHKATKEEILKHVWQYNPETETHTIESHLYALKQKLEPNANKLIRVQDGTFYLL